MANIVPGVAYETVVIALANTNETDAYTVGTEGESWIDVAGVQITDTGAINTAAEIQWFDASANADYVLWPASAGLPTPLEPLFYICEPTIRMRVGDKIKVTGQNGHHVFVTFAKGGTAPGSAAQT